MAENRFWFARRFKVGDGRNAMAPVSPEGIRVAWIFLGWMLGGAIGVALLMLFGQTIPFVGVLAVIVFIGCAVYGSWYFMTQAHLHGDHQHTVADYKSGKVT
jgi:hypothetical protein